MGHNPNADACNHEYPKHKRGQKAKDAVLHRENIDSKHLTL
jgi:hypothetical protein